MKNIRRVRRGGQEYKSAGVGDPTQITFRVLVKDHKKHHYVYMSTSQIKYLTSRAVSERDACLTIHAGAGCTRVAITIH